MIDQVYSNTLSQIKNYKFYLGYQANIVMQLCKIYIRQKYMTQEQYDQLSEFFKVYELLGGNGQAKALYERAIELPIVETIPGLDIKEQ